MSKSHSLDASLKADGLVSDPLLPEGSNKAEGFNDESSRRAREAHENRCRDNGGGIGMPYDQ